MLLHQRDGSFDVKSATSVSGLLSKNTCKYRHYFTIAPMLLVLFYLSSLGNIFLLCIFAVMENKISDHQAGMTIDGLSQQIVQVQDVMQVQAAHAVNLSLTARNWLIGHYIVEYEQHGEDRAQYGNALLKALAKRLNRRGLGER